MLDPAVGALLVGCYALLFASAALHKLVDLPRFAAVVDAYALLPGSARLAWAVPLSELGAGVGMLSGLTRPWAGVLGAVLLVAYALAIGVNLHRGRTDLACGCGGPNERRAIAPWMVWRNLALALLVSGTLLKWSPRPMLSVDALTVAAGVATVALLYVSLDRLLGQVLPRAQLLRGSP
ncbi:MAG: MauE/DoxX family redox-associated membrane protein [Steroidobacterales bacterium]